MPGSVSIISKQETPRLHSKGTYYIFAGSSTKRVVLAATDHQRPTRAAGGSAVFTQIVPQ
jgi:hypothetical protein